MRFRVQLTIISTILLSGSWCLSQKEGNIFWLSLSFRAYLAQIGIWLGIALLIYLALALAAKRSKEAENKMAVFIAIVSLLNLLDYGMRAVFGQVSAWPNEVLFSWAVLTLLLPALAAYVALKARMSRTSIEKAIRIGIIPCILLIYYALPSEFVELRIEKPRRVKNRPPIHLIIFDMLSYDVLFKDIAVKQNYPNFKSFSGEADLFLNCHSPAESTGQVIPRLLTGIDFAEVGHTGIQWLVRIESSTKMVPLSSCEALFSLAYEAGYDVFLRAFAFPYLNNFGKYIQSGRTYPFDRLWRVGMHSLVWPILSPGGIQHQKTVECILRDYLSRLHQDPRNTLFYTHWNIPHDPFIYDGSGKKLSRFELTKQLILRNDRMLNYCNQLVGTDVVFGQLIQAIKDSGSYDKSLIIVTADTNVGGLDFDMRHVPLFIKRPNQSDPRIIHSTVTNLKITNYIRHFIRSGICDTNLLLLQSQYGDLASEL